MTDRKEFNRQVFQGTKQMYTTDPELIRAVRISNDGQRFIGERETVNVPEAPYSGAAKVLVSGKRSIEAALPYAKAGKKVCVLNFASASYPGGGVEHGASAQEESICRITTLYPCLSSREMRNSFYDPHRAAGDPLHNDDCIYTPGVNVIKSDTGHPEALPSGERQRVDILTCAAPNLYRKPDCSDEQLEVLMTSRIKRIFEIAAANGCEVLILGAFGCGAFRNPPKLVSKVFSTVMKDYLYHFETIEYAVYHRDNEPANYDAFCDAMKEFER